MTNRTQDIEQKLKDLAIILPETAAAAANYVPYRVAGGLVFISGQLPWLNGQKDFIGVLGHDLTLEQGQMAARNCAINILTHLKSAINGDWARVDSCVKLGGFVNSTADFTKQPLVINGASDLLVDIFGDAGRHARFAVSAPSLPFGVAVEIDAIFALK